MNTLTAKEVRAILDDLDKIRSLTDLLRRAHFDVPYRTVYDAAGAETLIRCRILDSALSDVAIEAAREMEAV